MLIRVTDATDTPLRELDDGRLLAREVARPESDDTEEIGRTIVESVQVLLDRCPDGYYVHNMTVKRDAPRKGRPRGRRYYLTAVFERGDSPHTGDTTP